MNKVIFGIFIILLTGCATNQPQQLTRSEWLSTTSRDYEGVSKEQIINSVEQLFRLADGNDFIITHSVEGLTATRPWIAYIVIAAAAGKDFWQLKVGPSEKGFKATIQVNSEAQGVSPTMTLNGDYVAGTSAMSGSPVMGTAIYDVFWSRLDYLLGKRKDWMTCKVADERVKQNITSGTNEALCNSFNMNDKLPNNL